MRSVRPADPGVDRDRYLDLLRAAALVRVVVYHVTGWVWLSLLVPAMGLMFGIAGSLMAASLDRHGPAAVARRLRRLLLPFWAFGVATLGVLAAAGWRPFARGVSGWMELVWWVLPLRVPPVGGPHWAWAFHVGLWYVVTYLWLVLLSPVLLAVFRRWPWPSVGVATAAPVAMHLAGVRTGYFVAAYLSCWLLGFAHHDGLLRRVPSRAYACLVAALVAVGGTWVLLATMTGRAGDLSHIAGGTTLWSMALVAVLLRLQPRLTGRSLPGRTLRLVNARAVTIYLWHIPASLGMFLLLAPVLPYTSAVSIVLRLAGVCVLTAGAVLLLGWIEDVAARRAPTLLGPPPPGGRRAHRGRHLRVGRRR
ncbi:acyltransferase family protein [Micromonospora sp. WMMD1120]|uniref:acyltransferase family protein n=1 Tax=Micromonospora sp. WMMD1120 TaxID=3016106 RepID=UPI0024174428|nr:acyltransferase family protein [Micromonospora sp. WMMD1120]MDG4809053.1 acyltransferase family protein [Micromonospora sp. WMMD1120]